MRYIRPFEYNSETREYYIPNYYLFYYDPFYYYPQRYDSSRYSSTKLQKKNKKLYIKDN